MEVEPVLRYLRARVDFSVPAGRDGCFPEKKERVPTVAEQHACPMILWMIS
jgi:hypothetical protein